MNVSVASYATALIFIALPALANEPYATYAECGFAFSKTTFNMSPVPSTSQGIGTNNINTSYEHSIDNTTTILMGTQANPSVVYLTKDRIYQNDNLPLFDHAGILTAVLPVDLRPIPPGSKRSTYEVMEFLDYPFRSFGGKLIGDEGRMYGYSESIVTPINESHLLKDPTSIKWTLRQIEQGMKTRFQNVANAIIQKAEEREGIRRVTSRFGNNKIDLYGYSLVAFNKAICACRKLKGLENLETEMKAKLLGTPEKPTRFESILIFDNFLQSLVGAEESKIRALNEKDLTCDLPTT